MKKFYILLVALLLVSGSIAQWVPQNSGTTNHLYSVYFTDTVTGYAVGGNASLMGFADGTILNTINGGTNWILQFSGVYPMLKSVYFTNANTGYVVGSSSSFWGSVGIIWKTSNGGAIWDSLFSKDYFDYLSVYFTDETTGFIVGSYYLPERQERTGIILKTIDAGITWTETGVDNPLVSVYFYNANIGYAAGYQKIYKTTDGGLTWIENLSIEPVPEVFNSVFFTDINTGYAVSRGWFTGDSSRIYKTNDGGINWINQSFGVRLSSFYFTDPITGYIVGDSGTILKTTDGGTNWTSQASGTLYNLARVYFRDANTGYVVGDSGTILKTTNGGGLPVGIISIDSSQLTVDSWQLALCVYPNPVLSESEIRYQLVVGSRQLAKSGRIKLTLHDISGKQVQVLVDEVQAPGEHVVHFYASSLPDGIYFLRLQAGDMVETVKVVVMQ